MPKRIVTPTIIEEPFATLQLKYTELSVKQAALKCVKPEQLDEYVKGHISSPGPLITIGRPEWWHLTPQARQYVRGNPQKPAAKDLFSRYLYDCDLYLMMVSCGFIADVERQVSESQFSVLLRPLIGKNRPVVVDLFPRHATQPAKPDVVERINISGALRFERGGLADEESLMTIEIKNIPPVIATNIDDPSTPRWSYQMYQEESLVDARFGYMIIAKPRQAKSVIMQMDIHCDVRTPQGCFVAEVKDKDKPLLMRTVCKEWIDV